MFSNIQLFALVAGGAFVLIILASILGGIVEGSHAPSSEAERDVMGRVFHVVSGGLFLVLCVAIVPLILRLFTMLQAAIGNGDLALVKFFRGHECSVTYVVWAIMFCAILFALPTMVRDWWTQ